MDKLYRENVLHAQGFEYVCGVDEVGRGPLAGPVVCAAVIMPPDDLIDGVDDSKKLAPSRRRELAEKIKQKAVAWAICRVEPQVIDRINILQATRLCMKNAVESLKIPPDFVLTDGNMALDICVPQESIIALMAEYAAVYPGYGFEKNAGYGTAAHIDAIRRLGLTPIHRRSFTKKWQ